MSAAPDEIAQGLLDYVDASPSPFHACEEAARRLDAAGFRRLREPEAWEGAPGRYYVRRGGSLAAT